ncbi:MAG TPA: CaiB/BaiF CoA-transferase family protein [Burkholderiaceae bacterium]|nr:CaiB/BaiF CoA-transferase family protein [Burkholderiaceae bacterium]
MALPQDRAAELPRAELPLAGLTVIELHAIGPVPFAGRLLAQLGAEVTRVSPPSDPGLGVRLGPQFDLLNSGKQSIALDLKAADGIERLHQRLAAADVLLEGFRPGVLERLGLAPRSLLERHRRLVIGRLSGWGDRGPLAARAGHDINYLALSGLLLAIGERNAPVPPLNLVADFGGGAMHLVAGVLAQLVRRSISGAGGEVTTSILAGTVGLSPMFYGMLAGGAWQIARQDNLLDGGAPFYRVYRCADSRFVAVGALEPKFYAQLLRVLELDRDVDAARQYDRASWDDIATRFEQRFATRSRDDWARAAAGVDCCLAPVLDLREAAADAHNVANGLFVATPFPQPGPVIRFADAA